MDDFLVFLQTELLLDLDRFEPFDPCQGVGGEVHESFGEFFAILVEATDCISRIERAVECLKPTGSCPVGLAPRRLRGRASGSPAA